jgi:hypothetical protein
MTEDKEIKSFKLNRRYLVRIAPVFDDLSKKYGLIGIVILVIILLLAVLVPYFINPSMFQ